eukprot:TRINITY_DN3035_c0_g1_i1.p1 TRINITY_DN3035_c0_g1~~TRINITY_DN3035_c0_g1_i1.p1  ORF type:complete len:293 (-),score=69.63 TRINITY_DN3035_c0_g1_i1:117-995(-)
MASVPSVKLFYHADTNTCTYLVVDEDTKHAAVIDSCLDYNHFSGGIKYTHADSVIAHINENALQLDWILETHIHADHLTGSQYFKSKFPQAKVAMGKEVIAVQKTWKAFFNLTDEEFTPDGSQFDHLFVEGEKFNIGKLEVQVLYTPGHTPACVCYLVGDAIFTGDTVFMPGLGTARCDFPNGSARQLFSSAQKILSLPDATRQFVGHIYGDDASSLRSQTTLGEQRSTNKHVKEGTTLEDYVTMREKRDLELEPPKLILPSLQVNMRAGHLPKPEANGVSYLKLPLNAFAK